jgi:integrase/recombinase XerD
LVRRRPVDRLIKITGTGKAEVPSKAKFKQILLMASGGNLGKRNVALVWFLFGCGTRISETCHLTIGDILYPNGELKKTFTIKSKYTKTNRSRVAFILAKRHREAVEAWLDEMVEGKAWYTGDITKYRGLTKTKPVFPTRRGKTWKSLQFQVKKYKDKDGNELTTEVCSSMQNLISRIFKDSGLHGGSTHSGRRYLANMLDNQDVELKVIQGILGHLSEDMTLEYIDPNEARIKQAFDKSFSGIVLPDFGE